MVRHIVTAIVKKGKSKVKVEDFKRSKFGKWRTAPFGEGKGKEVYLELLTMLLGWTKN